MLKERERGEKNYIYTHKKKNQIKIISMKTSISSLKSV